MLRGLERMPIIALETRPMYRDRNLVLWTLGAGAKIFVAFGALALFMTVVGVYGVKSYMVARRTREIGIRVALGASPRARHWRMIVRDGFLTTAFGMVAGLALSMFVGSAASQHAVRRRPVRRDRDSRRDGRSRCRRSRGGVAAGTARDPRPADAGVEE